MRKSESELLKNGAISGKFLKNLGPGSQIHDYRTRHALPYVVSREEYQSMNSKSDLVLIKN